MVNENNWLCDIFAVLGVDLPTCFKSENGTIIDLIIKNVPKRILNVTVLDCGLSDLHNLVLWATKLKVPPKTKLSLYHSFKNFNENDYVHDLSVAPFHVSEIFDSTVTEYFSDIFSPYSSAFRKQHSCQSVLLRYVEKCKQALDSNKVYGALLTDLSKAFVCLPHC